MLNNKSLELNVAISRKISLVSTQFSFEQETEMNENTVNLQCVQPEVEVAPEVEAEPEPEVEPRRRGGARAAATAARSSLKEPTLGSKLRQGDRASNSVYDDFVPGTKRKSDRKSAKGTGVKKKKSSNGK